MKALFFDNGENYSTEEFRGVFSTEEIAIKSYLDFENKKTKEINANNFLTIEKLENRYIVFCNWINSDFRMEIGYLTIEDISIDELC